MPILTRLFRALVFWVLLAAASTAYPQGFPSHPIEIILPAAAGGSTDTALRMLASRWQEFLGQSVLVVNVPGAGGVIGVNRLIHSKPDGYTLMSAYDSLMVALPFANKSATYTLDNFDYLEGYGLGAVYFSVRSESPYRTMRQVIDAAKAKPGMLNYGSYGVGVITQFAAERLWQLSGTRLTYITYKSSPETVMALMGGQIDLAVTAGLGPAAHNPHVRVLAVAGKARRPDQPNIPTLKELGYPVVLDYISGIVAPKGLPPEVKQKLVSTLKMTLDKYGDEFETYLLSKAELQYRQMTGEQMKTIWQDRQGWFKELAKTMKLGQ